MKRRTMLKAGALAAASSIASACGGQQPQNTPPPANPATTPTQPVGQAGPTPAGGAADDGSLPARFNVSGGSGLQLFIHGLCGIVLPTQSSDPLRVAMIKGYPADAHHQHVPSLLVARDGVDVTRSTARPSAIDSNHAVYGLTGMDVTLTVEGVSPTGVKVKKGVLANACPANPTAADWDDFAWVLDMTPFFNKITTSKRRDWSKVGAVSDATFQTAFGSLEQDFTINDLKSSRDWVEWKVDGKDRVLKQAARLRILDAKPIVLTLTPRGGGAATTIVLATANRTVSAGILHLPAHLKAKQNPGTRLDDALAYYQMLDPSPLNPATDANLGVPLWSANPDNCSTRLSIECLCCPPSEV